MTITQLRYFIVLTEHLNITHAAKQLFISQATLSQHISKLEDELKVSLFQRKNSGLVLTPEGIYLKKTAKMLIQEIDSLPTSLNSLSGLSQSSAIPNTFSIAIDSIAFSHDAKLTSLFISAIKEFSELYPEVEFKIQNLLSDDMAQQLHDKKIDVALGLYTLPKNSRLQTKKLSDQPLNLVLKYQPQWGGRTPDFENVKKILDNLDIYIVNFDPIFLLTVKTWLESLNCHSNIRFAESGWLLQMKLQLDNIVAIVPTHRFNPEFNLQDLYVFPIPELSIPRYISWNIDNDHPLLQNFIDRFTKSTPGQAVHRNPGQHNASSNIKNSL